MTSQLRSGLLVAVAVGATTTILALSAHTPVSPVVYVAKPLTTSLLIALVLTTRHPIAASYRVLIVAGLLASVVGDVLLMMPSDQFISGLGSFLVAHLLYLAAFASRAPLLRNRSAVVGYVAMSTTVLALVLPAVGGLLRTAIILYVIAITAMASQAASWMLDETRSSSARLAAIGAALFVASDAVLALDRFVQIVPMRDLLVLGTYWLGQACIALSAQRPAPPTLRL